MKTKRIKLDNTKTGISIDLSKGATTLIELGNRAGKTRTVLSPLQVKEKEVAPTQRSDAEGELARRIRDLLRQPEIHMSKELWKLLGESPHLVYSKRPKTAGDAEITFYSKDKTHALLLDGNVPDAKLTQKQAYLFAHQLAKAIKDTELPLATVTVVFYVPEGSPLAKKLVTIFDAGYEVPTVNLSGALMSSCKLTGRGTRLAKNSMRYPMAITYKAEKISLLVTVKIVEFPPQLFL